MNCDKLYIMRFIIFLFPFLFVLNACDSYYINTSQNLTIDLIGTDEAFCTLSTKHNRYQLSAPGTTVIERDDEDLKVDCDDNFSDRRRVVLLESAINYGYFRYPENIIVDFSKIENGSRQNGFRVEPERITHQTYKTQTLTEHSFSRPEKTEQVYPVEKTHSMNRKSYPVPLENYERPSFQDNVLIPQTSNQPTPLIDPSVEVFSLN
jgi:hypothetical protein